VKNLKRRIESLDKAIDELEDSIPDCRQGLVEACPVSRDKEGRAPGVYRHENGLIDIIIYDELPVSPSGDGDDDDDGEDVELGYEDLLDSVRDELSEDVLVVVHGLEVVLPPLDEMTAPRG
jgi:hypothetical protein